MKKRNLILLCLIIGILFCFSTVYADLVLPPGTKEIGDSAFYGDTSLSVVVLPDGIKRIESKAFCYCGLTQVNLPDTLTYIAEDAFCENPGMYIQLGSEAKWYSWAKERGFATSNDLQITKHPASRTVSSGTSVTLTVEASGGTGNYSYQWYRGTTASAVGSKISGKTSASYTFTASTTTTKYYYYCKVTSGSESVNSNRAKVTIGTPTPTPTPSDDTTFVISRSGTVLYDYSSGGNSFNATELGAAAGPYDIYTVEIVSNKDWSVRSSSNWFDMTEAGDKAVLVINENVSYASMTGKAVFTVNGKNITMNVSKPEWPYGLSLKVYHKNQSGAIDANLYYTHDGNVEYDNDLVMGPGAGENDTYTMYVESNFDWDLTTTGNWFTAKPKYGYADETKKVVLTLNSNAVAGQRLTGNLKFICGDNEQEINIAVVRPSNTTAPTLSLEPAYSGSFYNNKENRFWVDANFSVTTTTLTLELYNPNNQRVSFLTPYHADNDLPAQSQYTYGTDIFENNGTSLGVGVVTNAGAAAGTWTIKITAGNSAGSVTETVPFVLASEPEPVIIPPSAEILDQFAYLRNALPDGYRWIYDENNPVIIRNTKNQNMTTYISQKTHNHDSENSKKDDEVFVYTKGKPYFCSSREKQHGTSTGALQCHGYAMLIGWALSGNLINDYYESVNSTTRNNIVANLKSGDVIRGGGHTMVVIRTDSTYIYVTDANWVGRCEIDWGNQGLGRPMERTIFKNGGSRALDYVYKYDSYAGN